MMRASSALSLLSVVGLASADYTGQFRPQVHFSPESGWLNDPNGLFVDSTGTYHLYYQFNPDSPDGGNQHWGHATSPDLYHWKNQPVALVPTDTLGTIWTGSAVIDSENTSGFFPDQDNGVVAIFTADTPSGAQQQALAYSKDDGYTFTYYDGNPILTYTSNDFRDPKVIWHDDTKNWVMIVSFASEGAVGFYTSPDLKSWTLASRFPYPTDTQAEGAVECPNISQLPFIPEGSDTSTGLVWMVWFSQGGGNGNKMQYFVGDFDGSTFKPYGDIRGLEFSSDDYAGQLWNYQTLPDGWQNTGVPGIHWATNGAYAGNTPTNTEGWRHAMTLPRNFYVTNSSTTAEDWKLMATPFDLSPVKGDLLTHSDNIVADGNKFTAKTNGNDANSDGTFLLNLKLTGLNGNAPGATIKITVSSSTSGESVIATQTFDGSNNIVLDRNNTNGFSADGYIGDGAVTSIGLAAIYGYDLTVVVDRSLWEFFVEDGARVGTQAFYLSEGNIVDTLTIETAGFPSEITIEADVYNLKSVWE